MGNVMKIGVISDTHGDMQAVECALRAFDCLGIDLVIHCGDIGRNIPPLFEGRNIHFVYGNMDDPDCLAETITCPTHTLHGEFGTLEIDGCHVAFLHGHDAARLQQTVRSGQWDLVCHGHSHVYSHRREGRTVSLNPGALARTHYPSVAVVDLPSLEVTQVPLS